MTTFAPNDERELADAIRDAAAAGTRLRIVGAGTWLDAGRPVDADARLDLGALRGVIEYVPGDLTLTARAATPLAEIQSLVSQHRQLLAMDPFGDARGTIGATVATASAGPLAHAFGTPRDNVIGLAFVDGSGARVRAGGRVVKNVAGFDLARLVTGAWGTLGAIADVSVRLRPMPDVDETVALPLPGGHALATFLDRLRTLAILPWALELVNAPLAEHLGLVRQGYVLARLAGNDAAVGAQRDALATLGDVAEVSPALWARLASFEPAQASVMRIASRPSRLAALCAPLFSPAAAGFGLLAHATVGRGVVRVAQRGALGFGMRRDDRGEDARDTVTFERLPASRWSDADVAPRATPDRLTLGVRRAFDPRGILNPGILH